MPENITNLILASVAFTGGHFFFSHIPVRKKIIAKTSGESFLGLYSLYSIITIFLLVQAWRHAPRVILWYPAEWARYVAIPLMFFACIFMVAGMTTKNPTSVGQESVLGKSDSVSGIIKITRHPSLWGFTLWSLAHLITNGDSAGLVFFLAFGILAFFGMFHIDYKRKVLKGEEWTDFSAKTSLIPFEAIIQGRTTFSIKEIGPPKIMGGIILFFILLFFHKYVSGVPLYW